MLILWNYIDQIVLLFCFVISYLKTIHFLRQSTVPIRKIPAFFVVFGPVSIATSMGLGHLFEISYHALERVLEKSFVFDFRLYSLILLGVVLLSLSVRMLGEIRDLFRGFPRRQAIFKTAFWMIFLSAPTGFFTPIGYVPTAACLVTLVFLPFVIKKVGQNTVEQNVEVFF